MSEFPSGKFERTSRMARAGLKIGGNYAKYHVKRVLGSKDNDKEAVHKENAQHLFTELTQLRGTALKLAQSLSMDQSGMLPDAYMDVMSGAQYKVPPINRAVVRSIIKSELGDWPENIFATFDPDAIAAASIGQVHNATSHDGVKLAVKIQYPNVRETIKSDLTVARLVFERIAVADNLDDYFDEIYTKLVEETDYLNEGKQIDFFAKTFNDDRFATPLWIPELSSGKVLSMTYLDGMHLDRLLATNPDQATRDHYGQLLWDFFHDQILNDQTIHADTHPGNFLFLPDGRLGIIDFGCVKTFPKNFFDSYLRALPLHIENNTDRLMSLYVDLDIYKPGARQTNESNDFVSFVRAFGQTFAEPYRNESYDFRNTSFADDLKVHIQAATKFSGPKGSRHFIFASRVHVGLYTLLMRLGSRVDVRRSKEIIESYLSVPISEPA